MLEGAIKRASTSKTQKGKEVLDKAIRLHCLLYMKNNMGWYLMNGLITQKVSAEIEQAFQVGVKDLFPHVNLILESFDPPRKTELHPPIVRDYIKFNGQDNNDTPFASGDVWRPRL